MVRGGRRHGTVGVGMGDTAASTAAGDHGEEDTGDVLGTTISGMIKGKIQIFSVLYTQ